MQTNRMGAAVSRISAPRMKIGELSFIPDMDAHCTPHPRKRMPEGDLGRSAGERGFAGRTRKGVGESSPKPRDGETGATGGARPTRVSFRITPPDFGRPEWSRVGRRTAPPVRSRRARRARACRSEARMGRKDTGRGRPRKGIRAPGGSAPRPAGPAYMPAARSWSRSTLDDAGTFCGRFSPSDGRASSWRCFTTVRLATMAARAINPTPKVRISASRSGRELARRTVRPAPPISEFRAERSFVLRRGRDGRAKHAELAVPARHLTL